MKPIYVVCVVVTVAFSVAEMKGQSGWYLQNSGTTRNLYSVSFTDANHGIVVGDSGTILRTTNGGATWTNQQGGTRAPLRGVSFSDANTATVVGDSGIILHTTDGGTEWYRQVSGTSGQLRAVCFIDPDTGTTVGWRTILRTTNGGVTWTSQLSDTNSSFRGVSFTDANSGIAVGDMSVRTTDGGVTWTQWSTPEGWGSGNAGFLEGANTGVVVGTDYLVINVVEYGGTVRGCGYIHRTTDGGDTWTTRWDLAGRFLEGVSFIDANNGIAVGGEHSYFGGHAIILRTTDGGITWIDQPIGTKALLNALSFIDANICTAVGDKGAILRTTTGGVTWAEQDRDLSIPREFSLHQNFPNPFNPTTTIAYGLPTRSQVTLTVFNNLGQQVAQLVNGDMEAGYHEVQFDGRNLSSGVYFYRIQAGGFVETKRLMLLR